MIRASASCAAKMPGGIEIKQLEVFYGENKILKGIDLIFPPGKVTAIIGPSGCGKTTLLRCLNRLSELSHGCKVRGQILLDGENILEMDPMLLRRRVGMVFQKPNPFPKSIKENILYGIKAIKLKCDHDSTVKSCLEKAALWDELEGRLNDSAFALSIGQQQRLVHCPQPGSCSRGHFTGRAGIFIGSGFYNETGNQYFGYER